MAFKEGDKIIVVSDYTNPESYRELVVNAVHLKDMSLTTEGGGIFYIAYCWPLEAKDDVLAHVEKVAAAKKVYDDIAGEVYALANKWR